MNLDSQAALLEHRRIIRTKGFLKKIYTDFYNYLKKTKIPQGPVVEIGSGAGFIKDIIPNTITSDVIDGPDIDQVFSATEMPFSDNSISVFFMFDVLHHIKNSEKALEEMLRCLKLGGKVVMIEPYNSLWGGLIFKYLYPDPERKGYNPNAEWKIEGNGRMSDSNPALPWIIFVRDRKNFHKKFPNLKVVKILPHTPFRYLISGGLTKWQFLPTFFYPLVTSLEKKLSPLNKFIGMFVTIELEKI